MSYRTRLWGASCVAALAVFAVTGCASRATPPAIAPLSHSTVNGPLMGSHRLIISVPLDSQGHTGAHLISATPTDGYNLVTEHAWVTPIDHAHGIEGVLRWPRPTDEDQTGFQVLQHAHPVNGFTLPATANNTWMLTLILTQRDQQRSMRSTGITAHYTVDGTPHSINLTLGFCFTTPTDTNACANGTTPT